MNRTSVTRCYKSIPFLLNCIVFVMLCNWFGQRGGFLCETDPAHQYSGEKNKIMHKLLTSNKGKTGSGFGTRNIFTEHQLVQADKPTDSVWLYFKKQSVIRLVMWQVLIMSLQPPKYVMTECSVTQITCGCIAGWWQNSSSGQTSCCRSIIYESLIELSVLVDFIEDVDTSCHGVRTCLNKW